MTTTKRLAITHPLRAFGLIWFGQLVPLVDSGLTGFAADTAPPLLVLGAQAVIASTQGESMVPLEAFFLGPGRTVLQPGELLKEIVVPIGQSGIVSLERIFNSRAIPAPGGPFSVNMTRYTWPDQPFSVVHGTSQRMIVDVSDLDNMLVVNSTGQSEHIFHLHRDDLISMWQNVEYHLLLFTGEAVEENAEAVLTLTPQ